MKEQGLTTVMAAQLLALLLGTVVAVHGIDHLSYIPQITTQQMGANITAGTFILETPDCVFKDYPVAAIWLLVSYANVLGTFPLPSINVRPYSQLTSNSYYMTLMTYGYNIPCSTGTGNTTLRVGANTTCPFVEGVLDCNGPLPPGSSLRVLFFGWDTNQMVTVQTNWSNIITLKSVKNPATLNTWPGGRSGGMIVITTILSVLLAILLVGLIATIAIAAEDLCWRAELKIEDYKEVEEDNYQQYPQYPIYRAHSRLPSRYTTA